MLKQFDKKIALAALEVSKCQVSLLDQSANKKFWASDDCKQMINHLLTTGQSISCFDMSYKLSDLQVRLEWEHIDQEVIKLFFDTLICGHSAPADFIFPEDDESDSFGWACIKRGLFVSSISGQGTIYNIRPATVNYDFSVSVPNHG